MKNWSITEKNYKKDNQLKETQFFTGNGYLGVRGNFEEGVPNKVNNVRGAYINAFYESEEIQYGEKLFGFPDNSQSILNVIDAQTINLFVNGEKFSLYDGKVLNYERSLSFKKGMSIRKIYWCSPKGDEVKITIKRMASFKTKELFLIDYKLEAVNFNGKIELASTVNGDVSNIVNEDDPRVGTANAKALDVMNLVSHDRRSFVADKTKNSSLTVVCGITHCVQGNIEEKINKDDVQLAHHFTGKIKQGEKIKLTKYVVYTDTRRHSDTLPENEKILQKATEDGFEVYKKYQKKYLKNYWDNADVIIAGDKNLQQGIRFNMYHLLQSVGRDPYSNIAAKGLSGEGYEGHYFWDTEIYIFSFFLFTNPELAKNLLDYRYSILDFARKRARQMGHNIGALYPWRTIAGDECSPFFPAGTAQYHINTDVAYAIIQYFEVTQDIDFMAEKGMESLCEISRLMFDTGHFRNDGKFCIDDVTGPDEYSCIVNNNFYTNVMSKHLFENTVALWKKVEEKYPEKIKELMKKINFKKEELSGYSEAAKAMNLPYDEKLKIHPQDDSFLNKKAWDFKNTPKEKHPLLLHFHPLTLYRHQVCKQADTVLAHFLKEEESDFETIRNDYHYYEKITTHDSSLSTCIFSIMASRVGLHKKAYDYFMDTARMDIDNLHHNTKDGIHTACMGGSWMTTVFGFAGMRIINGKLIFRPHLPEQWKGLSFKINFRGRKIQIKILPDDVKIQLLGGKPMNVFLNDKEITLNPNR